MHKILPYLSRAERITINILITLVGLTQYKKPKVKVNLIPGKLKQLASKVIICRKCILKFQYQYYLDELFEMSELNQ